MEYTARLVTTAYHTSEGTVTARLKAFEYVDGKIYYELRRLLVRLYPERKVELRINEILKRELQGLVTFLVMAALDPTEITPSRKMVQSNHDIPNLVRVQSEYTVSIVVLVMLLVFFSATYGGAAKGSMATKMLVAFFRELLSADEAAEFWDDCTEIPADDVRRCRVSSDGADGCLHVRSVLAPWRQPVEDAHKCLADGLRDSFLLPGSARR